VRGGSAGWDDVPVSFVFALLSLVVLVFLILLIGRLVLDWVQLFARDWKPRGPALVVAEAIYTATDPPLRALRKVIKPIRIGSIQLDLSFFLLFIVVSVLYQVLGQLARSGAVA
jgi:YggT family protein